MGLIKKPISCLQCVACKKVDSSAIKCGVLPSWQAKAVRKDDSVQLKVMLQNCPLQWDK